MRALVKTEPVPGAALLDIDAPRLQRDEVMVEVKAGAICGTDIHFYHWDPASTNFPVRFPLILGHEYAGDVVNVLQILHAAVADVVLSAQGQALDGLGRFAGHAEIPAHAEDGPGP